MFAKGESNLINVDELEKLVTQVEMLGYYFPIKHLPIVICSPLRVDRNPSFGIYPRDNGKIGYIDFKTSDSGDIYNLLGQLWGTSLNDTTSRIYSELQYMLEGKEKNLVEVMFTGEGKVKKFSNHSIIKCKVRDWKPWDIEYWEQYGISLEWLKFAKIYPISHILVTQKDKNYALPADKLAYVYVEFKDGVESLKIYQPYSEEYKWTSKHDASVWDLWQQLPETGEYLIINSSKKDALCIWENTGIPCCSLQAESYLPKESVMNELKRRFKHIFILYDNDYTKDKNYGEIQGKRIAETFGITQLSLPTILESKDPSDLCKNNGSQGRRIVRQTILELIRVALKLDEPKVQPVVTNYFDDELPF